MADTYFSSDLTEPDAEPYELTSIEDVMEVFGVNRERAQFMLSHGRGDSRGCCINSAESKSEQPRE